MILCSNIGAVNKNAGAASCILTTPKTITFDYQGNLDPTTTPDSNLTIVAAIPEPGNPTQPILNTKRCTTVTTLLGGLQTEMKDECP